MFEPFTTASQSTFNAASVNNVNTNTFTTNSKLTFFILFGFLKKALLLSEYKSTKLF